VSNTDVLLNVATAARLFHANDGTGFADLIIDGHRETWPLRSKRFGAWLRQQYYERTWDAPSPAALIRVGDSLLSSVLVAFVSRTDKSKTEIAAPSIPERAQRLVLFGPPLLIEGEDAGCPHAGA
jgi:hypothetical protein